ncbi:MAG: winged helix-turn-helix domain-containing protein [Ilumatobacteraceae bacterium]
MSPDYELDDEVLADSTQQLKAIADPVRHQILDLVLDRAATVTELAAALDRPKSSIAYHVDVLLDAGLLQVVRTRRVRAVHERFYGRVGRTIVMNRPSAPDGTEEQNLLAEAVGEAVPSPDMFSTLHHARIPAERAKEFFERVSELSTEFTKLSNEGDQVFGFVAAVYPTDHPILPEPT